MSLSHDGLARSLAAHLRTDRRMTWEDLQLGPSGSVRPDVYAIFKSYTNPCPVAYECKVSTADFRSDVTSGKWQSYLKYASGVYFACEGNLISRADVPAHCGLIVLRDGNWRAAKKAVLSPVTIPQDAMLKLLIDGVEREGPRYRQKAWSDSKHLVALKGKFGELVAQAVRNRLGVEYEIEESRRTAARIESDAKISAERIRIEAKDLLAPIRQELCEILGLDNSAQHWKIAAEVKRIRRELDEHPAHAELKTLTRALRRALELHGYVEESAEVECV